MIEMVSKRARSTLPSMQDLLKSILVAGDHTSQ